MGELLKGLECGSLAVPLDHAQPYGKQIKIALTRAKHTVPDSEYQGVVLLNRGQWPGSISRDMPTRYSDGSIGLPVEVGAKYDWIGFDARGVGASQPSVTCDPNYLYPGQARPDYVPHSFTEEAMWVLKAKVFADSCGTKYGSVLKFLNTKDTARDLDLVRRALGQQQINYLGYGYGGYLGSVYASMFPDRVRRMVLDTVVDPTTVGYKAVLQQNVGFEKRAKIFFEWIAKYDSVYHLGATTAQVEANFYKGMDMLRQAPIDGKIGPAEYTDIFVTNHYRSYLYSYHAGVLADWILRGDPAGLRDNFVEPEFKAHNTFAMYDAVHCRDGHWPRDWATWHNDFTTQYNQGNRHMTWANVWQHAPCAFWPVPSDLPPVVGNRDVNILMVHGEFDAAMPLRGALVAHERFPNSRFILERGGIFQGASLTANFNECLNKHVTDYFADGTRPAAVAGVDASCQANPMPVPDPM
ncbi:transporter [Kibdelosporangium aridum]|uniref:Transporter n=2 Tax=Kibdelosporangium aridum TaxID=2030 RepID=A0A428Z522_KIBAR|nr:transporter [Kibdelosporangium aridum]